MSHEVHITMINISSLLPLSVNSAAWFTP